MVMSKFHSNVAITHKDCVLCNICVVVGSDAIKWFTSSSRAALYHNIKF